MPAPNEPGLCVFCRRHPIDAEWRPFCSKRCKLQDLAQWADGGYRVPADPVTDDETDAPGGDEPH